MCTRPRRGAACEDSEALKSILTPAVEEEDAASRYPEVIAATLNPTGGYLAGLFP